MSFIPSTILAVVAHPDDLEIQCGGTIAKWVFEHKTEVISIVCSSGERGNRHNGNINYFELGMLRENEQLQVAATLGIKKVIFLRYPDGNIPYDRAIKAEIAHIIRFTKPTLVITHDPWRYLQLHPDHRSVGFSVIDAIGQAREYNFLPILDALGIVPFAPSKLWLFRSDSPNHFEEIDKYMAKKLEALECYKSQLVPWEEWKDRIIKRAEEAALNIDSQYAEPFREFSF